MKITAGAPLLLLLLLLLVSCSNFPRIQTVKDASVVDGSGSISVIIKEVHAASSMTEEEQELLLAGMEADFSSEPDIDNRLRLALLLATSQPPIQDRERARVLLEGLDESKPVSASKRGMVEFMLLFLQEQHAILGELESCTTQLAQQDRRIDELEQQQKELTSIEQNIQHRDTPVEAEDDR